MSHQDIDRMTKVSVVVPSLGDRPALLATTLRSITSQVGVQAEVLVVDASGEDRVRGMLKDYEVVRVVVADKRLTAGAARQLGTREASFDWIAYCDDDDLWAPSKLRRQLDVAARDSPWVYAGAVCFSTDRSIYWAATAGQAGGTHSELLKRNRVPGGGSSCLVHRDLVDEAGGWDPSLKNSEDWDMYIRLSRVADGVYVHAPLVGYRLHDGSKSLDVERIRLSHKSIYSKYGMSQGELPPLDWMYRREILAQRLVRAKAVYRELPERSWSSRLLRATSTVSAQRTARWLLAREVARSPVGWIEEARAWISALESEEIPRRGLLES